MADILTRIRKLVEKSRDNSSPEEAALAAKMASEMMFKYQIGEADLDLDDNGRDREDVVEENILEEKRKNQWKAMLSYALARGFGCHKYNWRDHKGVQHRVVGLKSAVQTVSYMFGLLSREIDDMAEAAWDEYPAKHTQSARTWKNSFRMGAVRTVRERLEEQRKENEASVVAREAQAKAAHQPQSTALALFKSDQERVNDTYKELEKKHNLKTTSVTFRQNVSAYDQGRKAGSSISLGGGRGLAAPAKQVRG